MRPSVGCASPMEMGSREAGLAGPEEECPRKAGSVLLEFLFWAMLAFLFWKSLPDGLACGKHGLGQFEGAWVARRVCVCNGNAVLACGGMAQAADALAARAEAVEMVAGAGRDRSEALRSHGHARVRERVKGALFQNCAGGVQLALCVGFGRAGQCRAFFLPVQRQPLRQA